MSAIPLTRDEAVTIKGSDPFVFASDLFHGWCYADPHKNP